MSFPYVACDVETTGLNHKIDEILEVVMIEFNDTGETGEKFIQMCSPNTGFIPETASAVNGITIDMVKDKPNYLKDKIQQKVIEFLGDRIIVGHNIENFDIHFLNIKPKSIRDTLLIYKNKIGGRSNLRMACRKFGIEWNNEEAHRAEYDAIKTIQLFCALQKPAKEKKSKVEEPEFPLFKNLPEFQKEGFKKKGITPTQDDRKCFATQTYSYSRINLFEQCAFKWYMRYIRGYAEPEQDYFLVGKISHKVAELAGDWCYRTLFANKFESYCKVKSLIFEKGPRETGFDLYDNPSKIKILFPEFKGKAALIYSMDKSIPEDSYERPSMPDHETYDNMLQSTINFYKCGDPDVISDVKRITDKFYMTKDFSITPGDITITEKRLAFDKKWGLLNNFYSNASFFRGIIDVIDYYNKYVIITDYKSSRKMFTIEKMKEDRQMQVYILLVYMFLPKDSYEKMIIRIEYIRYGKTVEYELNSKQEIQEVVNKALKWINDSVQSIEKEMLKTDGSAFAPTRNEYCHTCYVGCDGKCPLFDKRNTDDIGDPYEFTVSTIDDCRRAWKRVEANKSENTRLQKLCKAFIESTDSSVKIDETAILNFYLEENRQYFPDKTAEILLKKGIPLEFILKFFSVSQSSLEKLCEIKELELSKEEIAEISKVKRKNVFDAFTEKEIKDKNFLNS